MSPDDEMLARVRELRAAGHTPKQLARALNVRPAVIAPLIRAVAKQDADAQPHAVAGCWVSPGWSNGLTVDGHDDWPHATTEGGPAGIACVVVARRHRPQRVSVCGYLVDLYCLGVKNALGPEIMNERDLPAFLDRFFTPFHSVGQPLLVPLELARHLVCGAVDYARRLGFEPAPDFEPAAAQLGPWQDSSDITFGRNGVPCYVSGPYDNPTAVLRTLTRSAGRDNFEHITSL